MPKKIVKNANGNRQANSSLVTSANEEINLHLIFPNKSLLHNHKEYAAESTMPKPAITAQQLLVLKQPTNTSSSPTKLLVKGRPKLASENKKNKTEKIGIVCTKPL